MASPYIGEIRMFGGNFAPLDWAFCNGQLLSISQNDALFSLLGTTYGGDGQTTFALPDLQGRVPLHQGSNGVSNYIIGQDGGAENVTLTVSQIPSHTHPAQASSTSGGNSDPTDSFWASSAATKQYSPNTNSVMSPAAMAPTGGGQPFNVRMPYLAVSFIIALYGIFPSQS
jgi:microcystin-dependent protein